MVLLACALITSVGSGSLVAAADQHAWQGAHGPQIVAQPVDNGPPASPTYSAGSSPAAPALLSPPAPPAVAPADASVPATPVVAKSPIGAAAPTDEFVPVRDPLEKANRAIFAFDMGLDKHLVGPVGRGYAKVLPFVVRHHLSLVLANLDEPVTIGNNLLQLRMKAFGKSLARFTLNSTVGLAGIFDFASHHKLEHHTADFGQTLGRWGARPGPYVMLPLLGPSNLRDTFGRAVDLLGDPVSWVLGGITSTFGASRAGTEVVDSRANAEPALRAVYDSTDPYAAARSGYMQARAASVREATGKAEVLPDFDAP